MIVRMCSYGKMTDDAGEVGISLRAFLRKSCVSYRFFADGERPHIQKFLGAILLVRPHP
ncbi:hypothetical protein Arad_12079 (plasmid) [Rhizobium rhizogenes K84]|uniref:Uncharacterized protein n=1 Tax=Rhizobium rhizogenes (strain K84 / ATCC BAA-868) TaxID=311403 RepID=B9JPT2_RHIR8|nr:hypothetical protein Arad_12079 [Rhizobium rhizogenes K84]